ncbi:hypothetical protein LEN26_010901 [Aphanomyces euteiches]|nr:hypothetical protein LEN26_010901 [Aphanomyces euteiches]
MSRAGNPPPKCQDQRPRENRGIYQLPPRQPDERDPKTHRDEIEDVVEKWDLDFINTTYEMIFELILAANYLNIKSLLELACARMSGVMFGKTPEEIREMFGIKEQFTPEEE